MLPVACCRPAAAARLREEAARAGAAQASDAAHRLRQAGHQRRDGRARPAAPHGHPPARPHHLQVPPAGAATSYVTEVNAVMLDEVMLSWVSTKLLSRRSEVILD